MKKENLFNFIKDLSKTYSNKVAFWIKNELNKFQAITYINFFEDLERLAIFFLKKLNLAKGENILIIGDVSYQNLLVKLCIHSLGMVDINLISDTDEKIVNDTQKKFKNRIWIIDNINILKNNIQTLTNSKEITHVIIMTKNDDENNLSGDNFLTHLQIPYNITIHFLLETLLIGEEILDRISNKFIEERASEINQNTEASIILKYNEEDNQIKKEIYFNHEFFCKKIYYNELKLNLNFNNRTVIVLEKKTNSNYLRQNDLLLHYLWQLYVLNSGASITYAYLEFNNNLNKDYFLKICSIISPNFIFTTIKNSNLIYKQIQNEIDNYFQFPKLFFWLIELSYHKIELEQYLTKDNYNNNLIENTKKIIYNFIIYFLDNFSIPLNLLLKHINKLFGKKLKTIVLQEGYINEITQNFFLSLDLKIIFTNDEIEK